MMLAEPLDVGRAGPAPFRGALPSIRFSTGAILFLVGLSGLFGLQTGLDWLSRGSAHWVETCTSSAYAFMGFGALMMMPYSLLARSVCWILMCAVGTVSLVHHWSLWSDTPLGVFDRFFDPDDSFIKPMSAFLLLVTGVRTWAATRAHRVAPLLDGVILGLATASLLGYLTGFRPLYESSMFSGISFLESLGFLAIGALFLLADVEYARLNLRAKRFPAALGISAFAATISLRISEAALDGLGHRGLGGLLAGELSPEVMALGATNTIMSISIGAAAMFLLAAHDNTTAAEREAARRRCAESDLDRTTDCLNASLNEIARIQPLSAVQMASGFAPAMLAETLNVARLARDAVCLNQVFLVQRGTRVLTSRAEGVVHGDRGWLARALGLLIREAAARTADRTPLISVRLDRAGREDLIRVSFGGTTAPGPFPTAESAPEPDRGTGERTVSHALGLAEAVARWHGGRFWVTSTGAATTFHLALPRAGGPQAG